MYNIKGTLISLLPRSVMKQTLYCSKITRVYSVSRKIAPMTNKTIALLEKKSLLNFQATTRDETSVVMADSEEKVRESK